MAFYFRKSLRFGPLRLNLSKRGVGASIGVKGARASASMLTPVRTSPAGEVVSISASPARASTPVSSWSRSCSASSPCWR
jgi:hypothetical protein